MAAQTARRYPEPVAVVEPVLCGPDVTARRRMLGRVITVLCRGCRVQLERNPDTFVMSEGRVWFGYDGGMDISHIRRPEDWLFPIPEITADAINELLDALEHDARFTGALYDELDGATREMDNPDEEMLVRDYYLLEQWDREG